MNEHLTIVGNVATVPERRTTGGGVTVANFRVATSNRRLDASSGAWTDGPPSWYSVSAYRRLADHVLQSLQKGQRVIVTGRFRLREWESATRRGTEAEIDAEAVGPDLLFGTAEFRPDRSAAASTRAESGHGAGAATGSAPGDWGALGGSEADRPADGDMRAPLGGGYGATEVASGETVSDPQPEEVPF